MKPPDDPPGSPLPAASEVARRRTAELQARSRPGTREDVERGLDAALRQARRAEQSVALYAGTNQPLDGGAASVGEQLGMRPSMGWPGEKVQPGLEPLEELEVLTARAVAATLRAGFAEIRPPSATIANLAVYAALTPVGATLAVLPEHAGGHASHHAHGAPGIRGHRVVALPYDGEQLDVDLDALPGFLEREEPALLVVGGSLVLFPHRLREITAVAGAAGVPVLYDASHTAGLIAGGRFQAPLEEGATAVTFSTYKSYGGPPGGAIVSDRRDTAVAVSAAVYPGLTANYDAGRLPRLHAAATELLIDGGAYADRCIATAQALARALLDAGFRLIGAARGLTQSHHVAIELAGADEARAAVARLSEAGVQLSATRAPGAAGPAHALRMGTQELVRRGLTVDDMEQVADLLAAVLLRGGSAPELRRVAQQLASRA